MRNRNLSRREVTKGLLALGASSLLGMVPSARAAANSAGTSRADWAIGWQGLSSDLDTVQLELQGQFPTACHGVLYRNGPALYERNGQRYEHWFDPDGMVQKVTIGPDGVRHRGRFVRTEKYLREDSAQRFLFNGAGTVIEDALPSRNNDTINVANINVQWFGDELLALWEGGSAYRLDPASLATLGKRAWSDDLAGAPFSAHPRVDDNGDLWNFGSMPIPGVNALVIYQIGADGVLINSKVHRLDFGGYMHDFLLTPNYLVFLNSSAVADKGSTFVDHFHWEAERASQLVIVDKRDLEVVQVVDVPPAFVFHFGNAWEIGKEIHFTAAQYDDARFMQHGMASLARQLPGPYFDKTRLLRYRVDLSSQTAEIETLATGLEFPVYDRRFPFSSQALLFVADSKERAQGMHSAIARIDPETGARQVFDYGQDIIVEEPQFIPDDSGAMGSGYVLHSYLNVRTERSGIAVLRTDAISDGPIATAEMPRVLPLGFHGCFVRA